MPAAFYAASQFDRVEKHGDLIGVSTLCSYSPNVRGWISLAKIDESRLAYGDQVELVWGEPNGASASTARNHASLSRAVKWHSEDRVIRNGKHTIVFA